MSGSEFVLREECVKQLTDVNNNLDIIRRAVCGNDMRGGIVKDINKLFTELALLKNSVESIEPATLRMELTLLKKAVDGLIQEKKEEKELSQKQKAALWGSLLGFLTSLALNIFGVFFN
jgi:hypothetical protein